MPTTRMIQPLASSIFMMVTLLLSGSASASTCGPGCWPAWHPRPARPSGPAWHHCGLCRTCRLDGRPCRPETAGSSPAGRWTGPRTWSVFFHRCRAGRGSRTFLHLVVRDSHSCFGFLAYTLFNIYFKFCLGKIDI